MNTESITNGSDETGSSRRMRTGSALQPSEGFISVVGVVGVAVVLSGAFSSQAMVKLLENTFRAVNIGLINEVAIIC